MVLQARTAEPIRDDREMEVEKEGRQSRSEKALEEPVHGDSVHSGKALFLIYKVATYTDRIGTGWQEQVTCTRCETDVYTYTHAYICLANYEAAMY